VGPQFAPSLTNSRCWQERAVQTASGSTSSPEDTQGRGRGHRGSTKAVGQHADKQACSSPTPALTPPPINRPPPGFGHSMLEEGIRLPRTRVWSAVQLLLRASVRPLTISIRRRGQGHHLLVARPCRSTHDPDKLLHRLGAARRKRPRANSAMRNRLT
jgi:hypothetical protein